MSRDITITPFSSTDSGELIALWNRNLPLDAVTLDIFESRVLLDPNFQEEALLLASDRGRIVGFILGISTVSDIGEADPNHERAWITMMAVEKESQHQGIGTRLVQTLEDYFRRQGKTSISIATYPPGYFVPGIDIREYPGAITFFERMGFVRTDEAISMDAPLVHFRIAQDILEKERELAVEGVMVVSYRRELFLPYLRFMERVMPWDWVRVARENLKQLTRGAFQPDQIFLAMKDGEVVGYCQHEADHFGPFGVSDAFQGKGLGTVLLARTLERMHQKGYHCAWVLWTSDRAGRLYGRFGFTESRRFVTMRKNL
jgi:GNAT superfamily N-acetyltransferase